MSVIVASPAPFPSAHPCPQPPSPKCFSNAARHSSSAIRRRNALVPLPLLPPVPVNTIVTSVKILHNQSPISPPESPTSAEGWLPPPSTSPPEGDNTAHVVTVVAAGGGDELKSSPISPTQTSFYFSPLSSNKRPRTQRRRSCTPCSPPIVRGAPPQQMCQALSTPAPGSDIMVVQNAPNAIPSMLQRYRKPRSTIIVTVRRANPSPMETSMDTASSPPQPPSPRATGLSIKKPNVSSPPPIPIKPKWNKPRVSSGLATCVPIVASSSEEEEKASISLPSESSAAKPVVMRPTRTKKAKLSKMGSRIAMLRWAVLNQSGPEVGRRISAMGVRLAKEIWEAERCVDETMGEGEEVKLESGSRTMRGSIVSGSLQEEDTPMLNAEDLSAQDEREKIAEECIRDLEAMDVDQEQMDVDTVTPSSTVSTPSTPTNTSSPTPILVSHSQRRLSFPRRLQVRVDLEVFSKTASNSNSGCGGGSTVPCRRSLVDDKLSIVTAAKKWFEKSAL